MRAAVAVVVAQAFSLCAAADFQREIRPILEGSCVPCHTEAVLRKGIVPKEPGRSPLYTTLEIAAGTKGAMPPRGQLPKAQRDLIRQWIAEGAPWPASATFSTPKRPSDDNALVQKLHARIAASARDPFRAYKTTIPGTDVSYEMVPIQAGEFTMGSTQRRDESPPHKVRVDAFWMGKHEVTWDEYRLFMFSKQAGEKPGADELLDAVSRPTRPYVEMSFGMGIDGYPAISMTQHAANKYAEWLSAKTGQFYRLPTEAEWEYACRAGAAAEPSPIGDYAWSSENSSGRYQKVGTKKPNAWGLFDMLGNVMEWTLDEYDPSFYAKSPAENPWAKATKPYPHAVRGGSWMDDASRCRCSARVASDPSWKMQDPQLPKSIWYHTDAQGVGFRLVRPVKVPTPGEMYRYWNNGVEKEEMAALERFERVEPHMGTLFRITLYARDAAAARAGFDGAYARVRGLDETLSDYRPDSELNRLRCCAPARVSDDLYAVLTEGQKLAIETEGAFDVTLGALTRLWRKKLVPDAATLRRTGYRNMALEDGSVTLHVEGLQLDLGGIAKGYAADQALRVLRDRGIARALIAAGGDLAIGDPPPGQDGWRVGLDLLDHPLILRNIAVSTSGDTEQFHDTGVRRYSHILDTKTGRGLTSRVLATVIARKGIQADSLATTVCLLGPERGIEFIDRQTDAAAIASTLSSTPASFRSSLRWRTWDPRGQSR